MKDAIPNPPCVVYDSQVIDRQHRSLRGFLDCAYPKSRIFYALKACYLPPVVERMIGLGCGLEIATPSEHAITRHFRLNESQIIWNGPSLETDTLRGIVERDELLSIDSPHLFQQLESIARESGKQVSVALRLNPSGEGRLGMSPDQAEGLLMCSRWIKVNGFHIRDKPQQVWVIMHFNMPPLAEYGK